MRTLGITLVGLALLSAGASRADQNLSTEQLLGFLKIAIDQTIVAHHPESDLAINGYQVGYIRRPGNQFIQGSLVFYKFKGADGQDLVSSLDVALLPNPLPEWKMPAPAPGEVFSLAELLYVAKFTCDLSKSAHGNLATHQVITFKTWLSNDNPEFPVMARVGWRHTDPSTGAVAQGEDKFGCHKHDAKMECHVQ